MNFLKTLFWVTLAVVAVIFATNNWVYVPIRLWGGLEPLVRLPLLLLVTFLAGLLPTLAIHGTGKWKLRRRLDAAERALADSRAHAPPPPQPAGAALSIPATPADDPVL